MSREHDEAELKRLTVKFLGFKHAYLTCRPVVQKQFLEDIKRNNERLANELQKAVAAPEGTKRPLRIASRS
jgi:hypothetical protein